MMRVFNLQWVVVVFVLAFVLAILIPAARPPNGPALANPPEDRLEPYECGSIQRLHVFGTIFLASQPQPADLITAHENGIGSVINLREESELDWDEAGLVNKLEMSYHSLPFRSPESLTDEVLDRARELLRDDAQRPVIVHCSSANRVGAVWLAFRVLDGGITWDEALEESRTVGLRLPAYEDRVREYVQLRLPP